MTEEEEKYFSNLKTSKLLVLYTDLVSDLNELSLSLRSFDRVKLNGTDIDKNEYIKKSVFKMKTELTEHLFQLGKQTSFIHDILSERK